MPDMDYPKAAPLLEEIHVHGGVNGGSINGEPLRLAIEPPRPRRVVLESFCCSYIVLDWSDISSAKLDFELPLPFLASSKDLKHLNLRLCGNTPAEQPLVIIQSIQELILRNIGSACFMFTATSLPSLRVLEIHIDAMKMHTLAPLCCVFLRRSLCPLEVLILDLYTRDTADIAGAIQALTTVLEHANLLQQLSLRLWTSWRDPEFPSPSIEPLVQQFNLSRERPFLPRLQTLDIKIDSLPPFGLLLDWMLADGDHPPCGHSNAFNIRRPLNKLMLGFRIPYPTLSPIPQADLLRIFQLRAAGKTISVTSSFRYADGTFEVAEY
jgi:hypothetical protein